MQQAKLQVIAEDLLTEDQPSALAAYITQDPQDIRKALELRYRVFAQDMGAQVQGADAGIDKDRFDDYCMHLVVKDLASGQIVAYSRILTNDLAARAGGFYSATEFDISQVLKPGFSYMEIGRTCVDQEFRSGSGLGQLWGFIADYMEREKIDYLMGCCSIPTQDGYIQANASMDFLRDGYMTPENMRVFPEVAVPVVEIPEERIQPPSLLRAYLRLGVRICGELCLDEAFGVADVMILLRRQDLNLRYLKRIMR